MVAVLMMSCCDVITVRYCGMQTRFNLRGTATYGQPWLVIVAAMPLQLALIVLDATWIA